MRRDISYGWSMWALIFLGIVFMVIIPDMNHPSDFYEVDKRESSPLSVSFFCFLPCLVDARTGPDVGDGAFSFKLLWWLSGATDSTWGTAA